MTNQPLRAARWSRVSSHRQAGSNREGLPYQKDLQDTALTVLGATDTGITWTLAHSGGSVHTTPEWSDMLAQAGNTFDVLICPYTSRLARNAEELLRAERLVRAAGASLYFAEERCWTKDEPSWEAFSREAVEAESYRRRLSRTMKRTYESRWERRGLPAGPQPYGYLPGWQIDPIAAARIQTMFELYVAGESVATITTQLQMEPEAIKPRLRNATYAGFAQHNGLWRPGAFPPIISEDLFRAAENLRNARKFTGRRPTRPSMLSRRITCACGQHLRLNGMDARHAQRVRHLPPLCEAWGTAEHRLASYIEAPLQNALSQIRLTDATIEQIVANRPSAGPRVKPLRFAMERKALKDAFLADRLAATAYEHARHELDEDEHLFEDDARRGTTRLTDDTLRAITRDFGAMVDSARGQPHEATVWANIAARYIANVEYRGPNHLAITPTDEASASILPATLPQVVSVGGEGLEPPTSSV